MIFTKLKITVMVLFAIAVITLWIITPSYVCGTKCNPQWWFVLTEMTQFERMVLESAEACRDNPKLILELNSLDICDLNYDAEKRIMDAY